MHTIPDIDLAAEVDRLRHRRACVALAVGVIRKGSAPSIVVRGAADLAAGAQATAQTAFRMASITKTFTAIAIMQLQTRGLLDLDTPADRYLRAYRLVGKEPTGPPATVRQLLTHTAGLPEIVRPWRVARPDFGESVPPRSALPTLAQFYGGSLRECRDTGFRVLLHQPRPGDPGTDRRGCHWRATRVLPSGPRLPTARDDRHRSAAVGPSTGGPGCRVPAHASRPETGPCPRHGDPGCSRGAVYPRGHDALRRRTGRERHERARFGPGTRLDRADERTPLSTRSTHPRTGPVLLPRRHRRTRRGRAPGHHSGFRLEPRRGPARAGGGVCRRDRRAAGDVLASCGDHATAREGARGVRGKRPHWSAATTRGVAAGVRQLRGSGRPHGHPDAVDRRCWCSGAGSAWAVGAALPAPPTGAVPGRRALSRFGRRPLRLQVRDARSHPRDHSCRIRPRTQRRADGDAPGCHAPDRVPTSAAAVPNGWPCHGGRPQ